MFKKARYILRYRYIALVGRAIFWYIARRAIFWYIARVIWKRVVNYGSRLEIMAAFIMCAYGNQNPVKYVLLNRLIWNLDTSSRVVSCFWCQNYDLIVPVRAQHWRSEVTARFWILLPSSSAVVCARLREHDPALVYTTLYTTLYTTFALIHKT